MLGTAIERSECLYDPYSHPVCIIAPRREAHNQPLVSCGLHQI